MTRAFIDGQIEALKIARERLKPQRADGKSIIRLQQRIAVESKIRALESIRGHKI